MWRESDASPSANSRAMGEVMEASSAVSWPPLYHDMGLIGAWLGCMYFGAQYVGEEVRVAEHNTLRSPVLPDVC